MSVHRIMGIETEYGISVPGHPTMNSMVTSSQVVTAYARTVVPEARRKPRWDYDEETPLRDARGFDLSRAEADPTQLTDEDPGLANVILPNGGRLYVDHAHPEYSSPEVTNPRDAALWDRAGMTLMREAASMASAATGLPIMLYKNNTDNKGASYGCHENYLMQRVTPFTDIVKHLTAFFVTRQVFTGAGRLGVGQDSQEMRFQISQRADFFEVEVGLETTLKRPIINTRDEPHADPERHRRLHVIVGDANLSEAATYLKMGTTAIFLGMIEDGFLDGHEVIAIDPVRSMHEVSHDPTLQARVPLVDGRSLTAVQIQREYHGLAVKYCEATGDIDEMTRDVLDRWVQVLDDLETEPSRAADRVDWVAKFELMDAYRRRDDLSWEDHRLQAIDLQYADVRTERGLWARLEQRGRLTRMFDDTDVDFAVGHPPVDTRAYFRGECIRRFPESIAAASWDSVVFDLPGSETLLRVPTMDPMRGTKSHVHDVLEAAVSANELVAALSKPNVRTES